MCEVQCRERNFDRRGPAIRRDPRFGPPNTIPAGVKLRLIVAALLLDDQAVHLSTKRIDPENVSIATIVAGINQNFEVIVKLLRDISTQLRGNDSGGL